MDVFRIHYANYDYLVFKRCRDTRVDGRVQFSLQMAIDDVNTTPDVLHGYNLMYEYIADEVMYEYIHHEVMYEYIDDEVMYEYIDHEIMYEYIDHEVMYEYIDHEVMYQYIDHEVMSCIHFTVVELASFGYLYVCVWGEGCKCTYIRGCVFSVCLLAYKELRGIGREGRLYY